MMKRFIEKADEVRFKTRRDDIIKMKANRRDKMKQCVSDWNRARKIIFIGGISLEQIYINEGYTKVDPKGEIVVRDATTEEIEAIWRKYLLKDISPKERQDTMFEHMSQFMHQGGYINMLQASLNEMGLAKGKKEYDEWERQQAPQETGEQSKMGFYVKDADSKRRLDISVEGGKILMTDRLEVSALTGAPVGMGADTGDIARGKPLMVATGEYMLSFNKRGLPKCYVKDVILEHHGNNKVASSLVDQRSVSEKVKGFLENIYKDIKTTIKESWSKKEESSQERRAGSSFHR